MKNHPLHSRELSRLGDDQNTSDFPWEQDGPDDESIPLTKPEAYEDDSYDLN
jgi:hypothetical protein